MLTPPHAEQSAAPIPPAELCASLTDTAGIKKAPADGRSLECVDRRYDSSQPGSPRDMPHKDLLHARRPQVRPRLVSSHPMLCSSRLRPRQPSGCAENIFTIPNPEVLVNPKPVLIVSSRKK
jgi:hypothetical protein